jgi:hypothetical protein
LWNLWIPSTGNNAVIFEWQTKEKDSKVPYTVLDIVEVLDNPDKSFPQTETALT